MNSVIASNLGSSISRRTGVPVTSVLLDCGTIKVIPSDFDPNESFSVDVKNGWRHIEALFVPGKFARPLVRQLVAAPKDGRIAFAALADLAGRNARLNFRINQLEVSPDPDAVWPSDCATFEISLRRHGINLDDISPREAVDALSSVAAPVVCMLTALIGIDSVESDQSALEGDSVEQTSRRYERRSVNREICLALKGRRCWCCGFDFGQKYGDNADGFIEVHHRIPVSGMGPGYQVNPVQDLFPVCSNCHSVIHLTTPPLDPNELKDRLTGSL